MNARDVAILHIRKYVERGTSLERLRDSELGFYGLEYAADIGTAPIPGRSRARYGTDTLRVHRVNGVECDVQFRLSEIYAEIRSGTSQMGLPI